MKGKLGMMKLFFPQDHRSMEEMKKEALKKKKSMEETYIDEKFRVILFEEYIEVVEG